MRSDMEQMIKKYNIITLFNRKDIAEIENELREDEHVLIMYPCSVLENELKTLAKAIGNPMVGKASGVFALTDQRMIFCANVFFRHVYKEIAREDITECTVTVGEMICALTVYSKEHAWAVNLPIRPQNLSEDLRDVLSYYIYPKDNDQEGEDN